MTQEKKTTAAQTPGVYKLFEMDADGFAKASIIYPMENDYFIDVFKEFYSFIDNVEIIQLHISIAQLHLRLVAQQQEDEIKPIKLSVDEQNDFLSLLNFLAKIATAKMWVLKEERIMVRDLIKERRNKN